VRAVTGATKKSIPITQGAKPANIVEVLAGAVWGQPAQRVSAETSWPSRADGMVKLAESFLADHHVSGSAGERFQVMVHLDQDALDPDGPWSGTLEDGTHVSAETLRRVACDCGLVAVGHDGQTLNIGRRARSIPPAIRRALMLRDHGCSFPGCTRGSPSAMPWRSCATGPRRTTCTWAPRPTCLGGTERARITSLR